MLHAVEVEHSGSADASVVYVASVPSTRFNKGYVQRQLECYYRGKPPPDFEMEGSVDDERVLKGFTGDKAFLSEDGRRAFGMGV